MAKKADDKDSKSEEAPQPVPEAALETPSNAAPASTFNPEFPAAVAEATPKAENAQPQTGLTYGPGYVTCKSKSFHGNQEISQRLFLPEAATEDKVWFAFTAYHPSAIRPDFVIDPENKINPDLKTDKE